MKTNLDHLHDVCMGNIDLDGRIVGKTFASCHDIAGQVELGTSFLVVEVNNHQMLEYLKPMLHDVFADHRLPLSWMRKTEARSGKTFIKFLFSSQIEEKTRGLQYYGFVKVD